MFATESPQAVARTRVRTFVLLVRRGCVWVCTAVVTWTLLAGVGRVEGIDVDDEPVADVAVHDSFVGVVDVVDGDRLDLGAEPMRGAEVQHLLGLADTAVLRPRDTAPRPGE